MDNIKFFKSFNFNIFKFDKYQFRDNTNPPIPVHYFGCLIKGTAKIISKKETLNLKENEIFYIPKGLKYQSHWFPDNSGQVEFFSFGFKFSPINNFFTLQKINCSQKATVLFKELCNEIPITNKGIGRLYYFFSEVADDMIQQPNSNINPIIEKAIEYINEYPNLKIADIAKLCDISESGIYILFKKQLNKTPNDIRLEILCEKAVLLLKTTNKSIQEISDTLDFSSTSYFRKILHHYIGKTPTEVRKSSHSI